MDLDPIEITFNDIYCAIQFNHTHLLESWFQLDIKAPLNILQNKKYFLQVSIQHEKLDIVELFIKYYSKVKIDDDENTLLHWICENGHLRAVQKVLELPASNIDWAAVNKKNMTCLMVAIESLQFEVAAMIVGHVQANYSLPERQKLLNICDKDDRRTALLLYLHRIYSQTDIQLYQLDLDLLRLFLDCGSDVNHMDGQSSTPLLCIEDNTEATKILHKYGGNIHHEDDIGYTPLIAACRDSNFETVKYLIESGADVNYITQSGHTAFLTACSSCTIDIVQLLVQHNADIHHVNNDGFSATMCACYEYLANQKYVLEMGCDVNHSNSEGDTALIESIRYNRPLACCCLLIEYGADVNKSNILGESAITLADENPAYLQLLLDSPILYASAILRRIVASKFALTTVLDEFYRLFDQNIGLLMYSDPQQIVTVDSVDSQLKFLIDKRTIKFLLSCLKRVRENHHLDGDSGVDYIPSLSEMVVDTISGWTTNS